MSIFTEEGYISFKGYKTWYGIIGEQQDQHKYPLICLHGGPGFSHDYLQPLGALKNTGRKVVFYDQLGAGRSDHPDDPSLWTIKLYIEELDNLRNKLNLDKIHLLGQSWGGQLALEYLLTKPKGIKSLILADSLSNTAQ
jgi:proline-specific peptidase